MKFGLHRNLIASIVLLTVGLVFSAHLINRSSSGQAATQSESEAIPAAAPSTALTLAAVESYLNRLLSDGCPAEGQAILIQTLDGEVLVDHNSSTPLNPASVMKLATSYVSLKSFGPDYKFKTTAFTTGRIDKDSRVLYGDLVIESEGDPDFTFSDANQLAADIRAKISSVEGRLIVEGPLRFRHNLSLAFAYNKMKSMLRVKFPKQPEPLSATELLASERVVLGVHESKPLKELLLYMNAHSDNFYADQLGDALGGPDAVRAKLLKEFQLAPSSLYISHTSGLSINRITPKASLAIFRKMIDLLKTNKMYIEDIMPVAGVDSGTLLSRFRRTGVQGSIVAKTGTLITTDRGVSTLQGVIYSEKYGPLLFAIFNTGGRVNYFRRNQDQFLVECLAELATPLQTVRTENILAPRGNTPQLAQGYSPSKGRVSVKRVGMKKVRYQAKSSRYRRRR
jgi:serine-type D-Ala-D-Ala carboxypeptidase/endopeptidase (penicillin-binding protein 4)